MNFNKNPRTRLGNGYYFFELNQEVIEADIHDGVINIMKVDDLPGYQCDEEKIFNIKKTITSEGNCIKCEVFVNY